MEKKTTIILFIVLLLVISSSSILFFTQQTAHDSSNKINGQYYNDEYRFADYSGGIRLSWNTKPNPTETTAEVFEFNDHTIKLKTTWVKDYHNKEDDIIFFEKLEISDGTIIEKGVKGCSDTAKMGGIIYTRDQYLSSDKTYCGGISNVVWNEYLLSAFVRQREEPSYSVRTRERLYIKLNLQNDKIYSEILTDNIIYLDDPKNITVKVFNDYDESFLFDINLELKEKGILGTNTLKENKVIDIIDDYTLTISPTEFKEGCLEVTATITPYKDVHTWDNSYKYQRKPYYLQNKESFTVNKTICIIEKELTQEEFEAKYSDEILLLLAKNTPKDEEVIETIEEVEEVTIEDLYEDFKEEVENKETPTITQTKPKGMSTLNKVLLGITIFVVAILSLFYYDTKIKKKRKKR